MAKKKKQSNFMMVMNEILGLNEDEFEDFDLDDVEEEVAREREKVAVGENIEAIEDRESNTDDFYKTAYEKEEALIRSELAEAVKSIEEDNEVISEDSEVDAEQEEIEELLEIVESIEKEENEDVEDIESEDTTSEEVNENINEENNIEEVEEEEMAVLTKEKEEAIINKSMVVDGSLTSEADIIIHGKVNGDITSTGHVLIDGEVNGNVKAESLEVAGGKIVGNLEIETAATIKEDSEIHGDVVSKDLRTNAFIDGKITSDKVTLLSKAVVNGNITYSDLAIETGAKLKGVLNTIGD